MTSLAFWLSNALLLLYYLRKEPNLALATREMQTHLCDLINEIFVFVIRDAERRIDRVLEPSVLEYEAMKGLSEDLRFEGEWRGSWVGKKLTGGRSKSGSGGGSGKGGGGVASLFGAATTPERGQKEKEEPSPKMVTSLLESTLFILQAYEIPPSIVVQAFSQLFYWIACEVFNRLLTQVRPFSSFSLFRARSLMCCTVDE